MAAVPVAEDTELSGPPTADEFEAFDRFPWSKHKAFLLGLIETLGGPDALARGPSPAHEGSTAFCRTVFFRRQTGRRVDLIRYTSFLTDHAASYPSIDRRLLRALYAAAAQQQQSIQSTEETETGGDRSRRIAEAVAAGPVINPFDGTPTPPLLTEDATAAASGEDGGSIPSWMRSAPRESLVVDRPPTRDGGSSAAADEAPYSDKFAAIVEAIQTGKELEGIRQIPDTVVRQAGITPLGKLKAPRKPWETAAAAPAESILSYIRPDAGEDQSQQQQQRQAGEGSASLVDLEFPPLTSETEEVPPARPESHVEAASDGAQAR